jgi:hypothetical protein
VKKLGFGRERCGRSGSVQLAGFNGDTLPCLGDRGPISARNTSKGALLGEAQAVFSALASGASLKEARDLCLSGRILRQSARITRQHIWDALNWRYFSWGPPEWVISVSTVRRAPSSDATLSVLGEASPPAAFYLGGYPYSGARSLFVGADSLMTTFATQLPRTRFLLSRENSG